MELLNITEKPFQIISPLNVKQPENKKDKKPIELWWENKEKQLITHSGKKYGRILHRLIEQLNTKLLNEPYENTIDTLKNIFLNDISFNKFLDTYISLFNNQKSLYASQKQAIQFACLTYLKSELIDIILNASKEKEIYHEYTLQYKDKNILKKIRIDTLIKSKNETFTIIDYKTDSSIKSKNDIPTDYKKQLNDYKEICASILNIELDKIQTCLYICKNGKLIQI